MNEENLKVEITTKSNLFIGGTPTTFEIGGIDLSTVVDFNGCPYIPASSFKGALKSIVKDMSDDKGAIDISSSYERYLLNLIRKSIEPNEELNNDKAREVRIKSMKKNMDDRKDRVSAEYLFGIRGLNNTPKLLFDDLLCTKKCNSEDEKKKLFSIDSKNTLEYILPENSTKSKEYDGIESLPRTYKAVRPNVTFCGQILLYKMDELDIDISIVLEFVKSAIEQFNNGLYRMGNSGSRGYGRIDVKVTAGGESNV